MRILVAVVAYPDNNGKRLLQYVHTRNLFYIKHGVDVTVLNFSATKTYSIEGIKVIPLHTFKTEPNQYDILICHAPNLRNHYRFLKKYGTQFPHFVFFFHGHEVLKVNEVYSKSYDYVKQSNVKKCIRNIYDDFKLKIWNKFYLKYKDKSSYVFVSKWMLMEFLKWTKIPYDAIKERCFITYNSIGEPFENYTYNNKTRKSFDFITIRGNLDGSKYAIDIVNQIAMDNPGMKFLVIGRGVFFNYYKKADNITWLDKTLTHKEIIDYLQTARCALMPTRTDAQGVMMCEMASTGMPLITSDLPVCHEVFEGFSNVAFISNEEKKHKNVDIILKGIEDKGILVKNDKYFNARTSQAEVDLFLNLTKGN